MLIYVCYVQYIVCNLKQEGLVFGARVIFSLIVFYMDIILSLHLNYTDRSESVKTSKAYYMYSFTVRNKSLNICIQGFFSFFVIEKNRME